MGKKVRITEYLEHRSGERDVVLPCMRDGGLISARDNYKKGCLVYERDPRTIHDPVIEGEWSFSQPAAWVAFVEFYCPGCGIMIENELLPLGHPITYDIELEIDKLKEKHLGGLK